MMKLVILESPTKTRALKKYLGTGYSVESSNGHVYKLANSGQYGLGLNLENFEPNFIIDRQKKKIVDKLKEKASKASQIFIATDPDREGEAIAFHLAKALDMPEKTVRVVFNEITKHAVISAFEHPRQIDQQMVESQYARRIIDRMIGYRLSKLLQRSLGARSAGRVQSVALKIITNREKKIQEFKTKKTWEITANFDKFDFVLNSLNQKKIIIDTQEKCDQVLKELQKEMTITKIKNSTWQISNPLPLKTSTLLQVAARELSFSAKKTMFVAQKLYEGIKINDEIYGLISYPRTDSHRINKDFSTKICQKIKTKYGQEYLVKDIESQTKKTKKVKIQDAHEAIRITDINLSPQETQKFLTADEQKLYSLVYKITFASFMSPVTGKQIVFEANNSNYLFKLTVRHLIFLGFTKLLPVSLPLVFPLTELPKWKEQDQIIATKINMKMKISKPPPRFSEARLIKELESFGIGRPSTYSTFVSKLINWSYVSQKNHQLFPNPIGIKVTEFLTKEFSDFVNESYTAQMENDLDQIVTGKKTRINFLSDFWKQFNQRVSTILDKIKEMEKTKITDKQCPNCKGETKLQERIGRYGTFLGCENYPKCHYIDPKSNQQETLKKNCPKCNKPLSKRKGKYGDFVGCTGYPECRYIENSKTPESCPNCQSPLPKVDSSANFVKCQTVDCNFSQKIFIRVEPKILERLCPNDGCQKPLVERQGRFGKFIACSGFPKCRYIEKNVKK